MKLFVIAAMAIVLVSCAKTPREMKSQEKDFRYSTRKNYEEVAQCITTEYDERIRIGPLRMSTHSSMRILKQKKGAEIVTRHYGEPITVTSVYPQGQSTKIDVYMYFVNLYVGLAKQQIKSSVESCI